MKRLALILLCLPACLWAETPLVNPQTGVTKVAPYYFGANAFPVPDMLDGRTQEQLRVELAGDGYWGFEKDKTADLFARIYIPLWTPRVNLTVWMPMVEWYAVTAQRAQTCRLDSVPYGGHGAGDVYLSVDVHALKQGRYHPDLAFRAALKTASGGQYALARHFDAPGYWFDLAAGKSIYINKERVSGLPLANAVELRLAADIGFLCWQTDVGRQNDALYYGLQCLVDCDYVSLRATWGGYMGWEKDGDRPMTLKVQIGGHIQRFEPFVVYQYGIKDYPFHQLRVGLACHFDILNRKEAAE